jgi:transposase-like protein
VIRKQQASGLGVSAFCREHEVPPSSFFQWRRKLKEPQRKNETARDERALCETSDRNTTAKFVPVRLDAPTTATRAACEVVLPDGCRIIVPIGCDANWLREILGTVARASC